MVVNLVIVSEGDKTLFTGYARDKCCSPNGKMIELRMKGRVSGMLREKIVLG